MEERTGKGQTKVSQRFGGFAVCHMAYSVLSLVPIFFFYMMEWETNFGELILWVVPLALMLFYFPLGVLVAWMSEWARPQATRERVLAIALPTLVAWIWVGVVLGSMAAEAGDLLIAVYGVSVLFAAPSSLFVLIFTGWLPASSLWVALGTVGLLAGFLPPFLFALGSFWQAGRRESRQKEAEA